MATDDNCRGFFQNIIIVKINIFTHWALLQSDEFCELLAPQKFPLKELFHLQSTNSTLALEGPLLQACNMNIADYIFRSMKFSDKHDDD